MSEPKFTAGDVVTVKGYAGRWRVVRYCHAGVDVPPRMRRLVQLSRLYRRPPAQSDIIIIDHTLLTKEKA